MEEVSQLFQNLAPSDSVMPDIHTLSHPHNKHGTEFGIKGLVRANGGGVRVDDKDQMAQQRGVFSHLLKSIGANLIEGKSVINVSLPVRIFEARSFIERMTDVWGYAPIYMNRAAITKDPVERMKLVVSWFIAGLYRATVQLKPFNPILGETFQAHYTDGCKIVCEQVCHHPPISAFEVVGPANCWMYHGYHECTAAFRPNGILAGQVGTNNVDFPDGTRITFNYPHMRISGILFGDRVVVYEDTLIFEDKLNGVRCEVEMNPDGLGTLRSLVQTAKSPADTLRGSLSLKGEVLCNITGSWLDSLVFGDQVYWKLGQYQPYNATRPPDAEVLPSDSRFRTDLKALKQGDMELAQQQKEVLETEQRQFRKLRTKWNKQEEDREREYYKQQGMAYPGDKPASAIGGFFSSIMGAFREPSKSQSSVSAEYPDQSPDAEPSSASQSSSSSSARPALARATSAGTPQPVSHKAGKR